MAKRKTYIHKSASQALFGSVFAYVSQLLSPVLLFVMVLSLFAPFIPTDVSANHTSVLNTVTIDSDATWTVPDGITQFTLKIWGAGGNGGNGGALGVQGYNGPGGGGGGGAGAYGEKVITVTPATRTITASIAPNNTAMTTVTVGGMVLSLGSGGNGGVGLEYSGGGEKQGVAYGGPGGLGGVVDPASVALFDVSRNGADGAQGSPGGYANSMSGYGFPGAGGAGANGFSVPTSGGAGGADPSGSQSYSGGGQPGLVGTGFGGGGGGGAGYGGVGAVGARGRLVVEYSTPIADPIVPPTISCSATAGVLDVVSSGVNTILSWSTNTPASTVLEVSGDLVTWSVVPTTPTIVGGCYTVTASTTNALAQTNLFRLTPATPVVPPTPAPTVSCSATPGVLSTLPQGVDTLLSWSITTPATTVLQLSTDLATWVTSPTVPTASATCFSVIASTTNATGLPNAFRLFTPVVVPPTPVPVTLKDLTLVGPLRDATVPLSASTQQVTFTLPSATEVMVYAYANVVIPNSVSSTVSLSLDGTVMDSALISDAAITGGGTASLATLTTHTTSLSAGSHTLTVNFPAPGSLLGPVTFYVYQLDPAVSQTTADMAIVGPLSTTTALTTSNYQKVSFTVPTTSDVILYSYVNAGIPNSVSAPVRMLLNGAVIDTANISDAAITGGATQSVFTMVARRTLTAGTYELASEVPAPGYIYNLSKFYVQYLNPAPTDPTTLQVLGPITDAAYTANTQTVPFTLSTPSDVVLFTYAPVGIPNSVASTLTLSLDGIARESGIISDAAITGGGTRSLATLATRQTTLSSGAHTASLAFPAPGSFDGQAKFYVYRLNATSTLPVAPILPTCSATAGVLSITPSGIDSILTWATTTPLALVAQSSTDGINWTTITTAHPVINNCFSVTASTTVPTGVPNLFRLFDTTPAPVIPPATMVTCPATPGVLALAASSTDSILTWASTTPTALVAQSSTDLTNWTTLTLTPPIVNNCFTVVASTTAPSGLTNFFRLFDTTPVGGGGGGGTPTPTVSATFAISGATTTAPINNLPFALTVGGTAVGSVFYQIDCTTDGAYEYASSTPLSSFVTPGICTYTNPGTYTATAQVGRENATTTVTTIVTVLSGTTIGGLSLSLDFSVTPNSGVAPLNNVGFSGAVSGSAITGTATTTFSFDCLNDGSYEFSGETLSTSMTQGNLCSYTNPGTYVARLLAVRGSFMVSATTSVTVLPVPLVPPSTGGGGGGGSTPTVSTGGGGGGGPIGLFGTVNTQAGGGGGGYVSPQQPQPVATGASCTYLTEYMRADFQNSVSEVAKLQVFLKDTEKMDVSLTNVFDKQTEDAVKAFQVRYSKDVLEPWATTTPTGYVFITTLKKINDIKCAGQAGYTVQALPDLSQYSSPVLGADDTGTSTVQTPFGSVNIGSSTPTTNPVFDGVIGSVPTNTIIAQATTTDSSVDQSLIIRGQQNVATALNAVSDIVLYVFNAVRGAGGLQK